MSLWSYVEIANSVDNGDGTTTYSFKYSNSDLLKYISSTLQNTEDAAAYAVSKETELNNSETKICVDTIKSIEDSITNISNQITSNASEMNSLLTRILTLKAVNFDLLSQLSDKIKKLNSELDKF